MEELIKEYKRAKVIPSIETLDEKFHEYVYYTNKLEGNSLTLLQTTQILKHELFTGNDISLKDILEQKGMLKAVKFMYNSAVGRKPLTVDLLKELNKLTLSSLWVDDYYADWKYEGQKIGDFKCVPNEISTKKPDGTKDKIIPLSHPGTVKDNMSRLIDRINESQSDAITKSAFIAQEIFLHQPFPDGNKRLGRLLISFLTVKDGLPLFSFNDEKENYNSLLLKQYYEKKPGLVENYISNRLKEEMTNHLQMVRDAQQNMNKGYRFML